MSSLDFLYIALGAGFLIVSIFLAALILNLTLTLRDVNKITANAKDISDRVKETVFEPLKVLSEATAGFSFIHELIEKLRSKYEDMEDEMPKAKEAPKKPGKEKGGFSFKKLGK